MSRLTLWLFGLVLACSLQAQQRFRLMEYNVENLFDTIHAEGMNDLEFTPEGDHHWNTPRYWGKLGRLCRVIAAAGGETPVDLVALVEVENDSVVSHLTRRTRLRRLGYDYVTAGTDDARGIRVALLYQPVRFKMLHTASIRFAPPDRRLQGTRHALHVAGELVTGDTLDLIVCHWPSRRGAATSARYREYIGRRLRTYCDSLMNRRQRPYLVLTGDFNSWYPEKCLREALGTRLPPTDGDSIEPQGLYVLSHGLRAPNGIEGTYKYQGEWNQLDQFIVSGTLLNGPAATHAEADTMGPEAFGKTKSDGEPSEPQNADNSSTLTNNDRATSPPGASDTRPYALHTDAAQCRIADFPYLLQKEKGTYGGVRPYRTYLGTYYQGGISDHLPLVLDLYY